MPTYKTVKQSNVDVNIDAISAKLRSARTLKRIVPMLTVCLALLWAVTAVAQHTTGTIRGQVLDPAGATVAASQVSITNEATGVVQTSTTSSAGTYEFPSVLPGTYTLSVEAAGFKKYLKKGIPVLANQDNVADARMDIGATS
jgi:peptidoglycan/LPS O-acetylase OafA/YrhL